MEVLVALSILAVGIIGVLGAFSLSVRTGANAVRVDKAAAIAEWEIVRVAAAGAAAGLPPTGESGPFQWRRTVSTVKGGLSRVTVVVSWTQRGKQESFELAEVFRDR